MVGQNIGKYRVLDRIGRGGMGTVYRATDETLHRDVAIKVLNAELNDPEIAKRFRAEAITVARLSHPGIATIYELLQHDGQWLMVMEFVRGETLEHLVDRSGPLSAQRAAELCMQALSALSHAHSVGVVHRDLKPANMMITDGIVKIMDFGIARVAGTEHLTSAGFMMGTPAYMAPEQVMGNEIDARADLYAIGVVFYRLATGKLPFKGETPFAMAQSQVNDPPTPMGLFRTDLPAWVEQVIARALSKRPEERYQSAAEFHEVLAKCVAGQPLYPAATAMLDSAPTELMTTPAMPMPSGFAQRGFSGAIPSAVSQSGAMPPQPSGSLPAGSSGAVARSGAIEQPAAVSPPGPVSNSAAIPSGTAGDAVPGPVSAPTATAVPGAASRKRSPIVPIVAAVVVVALIGAGAAWFRFRQTAVEAPPIEVAAPVDVQAPVLVPDAAAPTATVPAAPPAAPPARGAGPSSAPALAPDGSAAPPSTARGAAGAATPSRGTPAIAAATVPAGVPVDDSHQAFTNVKVLVVTGRKTRDEDVVLSFVAGQISVLGAKGGATLVSMPYKAVAHATYVHARDPKWDEGAPVSPPKDLDVGGVLRTSKHWLVLQSPDAYTILRLEDENAIRVLQTIEARTGLAVDRPKSN